MVIAESSHTAPKLHGSNPLLWAVAFLLVQAVIRLLISPSLQADEAEIVLSAQEFRLGYDDHPPLYAWLYIGISTIFGTSLFSLALLKYSLLVFGVIQAYRCILGLAGERLAGLVIVSYLFFWQIMPKMQIDYTHSVLLFAMTTWYIRQLFVYLDGRRTTSLVLLALIAGLGLLTKPNFAVILLGSLTAALLNPDYRRFLTPSRLLLFALLAGLVASPYLSWLHQTHIATIDSQPQLAVSGFSIWGGIKGVALLGVAIVANFLPFSILGMMVLKRSTPHQPLASALGRYRLQPAENRLLVQTLVIALLLLALAVFVANAAQVKERYLIPLDIILPMAFALCFKDSIHTTGMRFVQRIAILLALLLILFNVNEIIKPYTSHKADTLNLPYRSLKPQILANGFTDGDNILLTHHLDGGNLRRLFPGSRVVSKRKNFTQPDPGRNTMLIWVADRYGKTHRESIGVPPALMEFAERFVDLSAVDPSAVRFVQADYFYYPERAFRMGMLILPARYNH